MSDPKRITATVQRIVAATTWNNRVALVRGVPEEFGKAQHQPVYAAIAEAVYVPKLAPDFAYIHWRDEYELQVIERSYEKAHALTNGFVDVDRATLARTIEAAPITLRVFRLLLGLTTQEFAASTTLIAPQLGCKPLSNSAVKSIENGGSITADAARIAAAVIDQIVGGSLYQRREGDLRSKIQKPDTSEGWATIRRYSREGVPLPVFLHQR